MVTKVGSVLTSRWTIKLCRIGFFYFVLFSLFFPLYSSLHAAGRTAAEFLNLGLAARPSAMGQAYGAISGDPSVIYSNPAGLADINCSQVTLNYNEWVVNTKYGFIGFIHPIKNLGVLGVSAFYLHHGEIIGRTASGHRSSNFTASDQVYTLSYAYDLKIPFVVGLNLKFIQQEIATLKAQTIAIDIGTIYQSSIESLKFGLSLRNAGGKIRFIKEEAPLPTKAVLSVAYQPLESGLLVAGDLNLPFQDKPYVNFGFEYLFGRIFAARLGLSSVQKYSVTDFPLSYGFGIKISDYSFDYAFIPFGDLGDTHRISLSMKFGRKQ